MRLGLICYLCFIFVCSSVKNAVFWNVAPCRSCVNRRFGGTYRHHVQGRKISERGTSVSRWLQTESPVVVTLVLLSRIFLPLRWRLYVPPKRRFAQDLHGATSQEMAFFIVTVLKTSNLTYSSVVYHWSQESHFRGFGHFELLIMSNDYSNESCWF
jgi:hypothetical protein